MNDNIAYFVIGSFRNIASPVADRIMGRMVVTAT
jgi:hypothetical protein